MTDKSILIFLPHNANRYKFGVDDGKLTFINKGDIVGSIRNFINPFNEIEVLDLVKKNKPFIVDLEEGAVSTLNYSKDTNKREKIDIERVIQKERQKKHNKYAERELFNKTNNFMNKLRF